MSPCSRPKDCRGQRVTITSVLRGAQQTPTAVLPLIPLKPCLVFCGRDQADIHHLGAPPNADLCIHPRKRERLSTMLSSSPTTLTVPGEEVKDLLLAAGDSSKSFHDGTGCLPCCLCCWGKEYLPDMGEEMRLFFLAHRMSRHLPIHILKTCLGQTEGPTPPASCRLRKTVRELSCFTEASPSNLENILVPSWH